MTDFTRRDLFIGGAAVLATATLPAVPLVAEGQGETSAFRNNTKGEFSMATITTKDGTTISTRTGGRGSRSFSRMVGHSLLTHGTHRCCF